MASFLTLLGGALYVVFLLSATLLKAFYDHRQLRYANLPYSEGVRATWRAFEGIQTEEAQSRLAQQFTPEALLKRLRLIVILFGLGAFGTSIFALILLAGTGVGFVIFFGSTLLGIEAVYAFGVKDKWKS